ncbi:hypothetical protein [Amycolatopsis thermoflava]|uniref:hypothetical protein n=1 Tax=Amycolatopsis thermoflava TaxID=84480 RepID=UPI00040F093B|nr:hypothetical protein [Amycolatopsis thermoflava]
MPTAVGLFALDWAADLNQAIRQATEVHLTQGVVIALALAAPPPGGVVAGLAAVAPERPHARRADEVDPGRGPDRGHEACHAG